MGAYFPGRQNSSGMAAARGRERTSKTRETRGSESFSPVSVESEATRSQGGHNSERTPMHTNMNALTPAPMVRVHPRAPARRPSVDEALARARLEHEDWYWLYESQSNLAIPGAVDLGVVAELVEGAPNDFLAGIVIGMALNN